MPDLSFWSGVSPSMTDYIFLTHIQSMELNLYFIEILQPPSTPAPSFLPFQAAQPFLNAILLS